MRRCRWRQRSNVLSCESPAALKPTRPGRAQPTHSTCHFLSPLRRSDADREAQIVIHQLEVLSPQALLPALLSLCLESVGSLARASPLLALVPAAPAHHAAFTREVSRLGGGHAPRRPSPTEWKAAIVPALDDLERCLSLGELRYIRYTRYTRAMPLPRREPPPAPSPSHHTTFHHTTSHHPPLPSPALAITHPCHHRPWLSPALIDGRLDLAGASLAAKLPLDVPGCKPLVRALLEQQQDTLIPAAARPSLEGPLLTAAMRAGGWGLSPTLEPAVSEHIVRALAPRPSTEAVPTAHRMYAGLSRDGKWRLAIALSTDQDAWDPEA